MERELKVGDVFPFVTVLPNPYCSNDENIEDANSFIETMKEGMYYKSIRPDCILIAMEVLNFI